MLVFYLITHKSSEPHLFAVGHGSQSRPLRLDQHENAAADVRQGTEAKDLRVSLGAAQCRKTVQEHPERRRRASLVKVRVRFRRPLDGSDQTPVCVQKQQQEVG